MDSSSYAVIGLLTLSCGLLLLLNANKYPVVTLPPGPPADPIIGHIRSMPLEYAWKTFAEWRKKYGDIIYLHILGQPIVVLNSFDVAKELMEKKGANSSDRPPLVFYEMMGWGPTLVCLPYGERWRRQRRFVQPYFSISAVPKYRPLYQQEINKFLKHLSQRPHDLREHVHRLLSSIVALITYGHEVKEEGDHYSELSERSAALLVEYGNAGGTPVDLFAWLRHIPARMPGAGFKRHAIKTRKVIDDFLNVPFDEVKEGRANGTGKPSFASNLLDEYEKLPNKNPIYEEDMKYATAIVHSAGVETSEGTLMTFFLLMMYYPEVAKRAQNEIDKGIGTDRLPSFDDRPLLPYIQCILKETLRFNPPVPLGIPHRTMQADELHRMSIPAGSMVIGNIWQMSRDESYFPNPEEFRPERFEGRDVADVGTDGTDDIAQQNVNADDPSEFVFGFGRRVCPGRHFAEAIIWLVIANVR